MKVATLVKIWTVLLFMLGASLLAGSLGNERIAVTVIFMIAAFKAWLVSAYYMRLKWEPHYITMVMIAGILLTLVLYFALVPDILYVYGK